MESKPTRVFGLGTIVLDHHVVVDALPEPDAKAEALEVRYQVGGPVPTALCLLRRFGREVMFHGMWANDGHGKLIEEDLEREGVAFHAPAKDAATRSGFAHVWVERGTGRRSIVANRGSHAVAEEHVDPVLVSGHGALHLDGWSGAAAEAAATAMRASGGRVFMDLGSPKPGLERLLACVDVLNCPARLIERLFQTKDVDEGAQRLLALGPSEVTVTDGENGAHHFAENGESRHQPAFEVRAVDTNGAGDVFAGAIVHGTLMGWTPERKLRFAAAAAALKCRRIGNRDALPDLGEIEALLNG